MKKLSNVLNLIVTNIFGAVYVSEFVSGNISAPFYGWLLIIAIVLGAVLNDIRAIRTIVKKVHVKRVKRYLAKRYLANQVMFLI